MTQPNLRRKHPTARTGRRSALLTPLAVLLAIAPFGEAHPHGNEARLVEFLDWKPSPRIARVVRR